MNLLKMPILRRALFATTLACAVLMPATAAPQKVLRYAFLVAETSLDPVKIGDLYSRTLTPHVFEAMYQYDHLARPLKIKPLTAEGMPVGSADFKTWTVKIRPGIFFASDPAFKGAKRELVAQDYAYALKRFADPANKSPAWASVDNMGLLGLGELRKELIAAKKPFDYDREIEGIRAIDRYTLQFRVAEARPRFVENLAGSDLFGAVAREVVEFYGEQIDAHPVGTGPFKLVQWRRSSKLVFDRNPEYRERYYDAEPAADDAEGQALLARFKGRRLPMVDRVEISIIEQDQPRWLSFINGEADFIERVSAEFITKAMPGGKVAPNLAKQGIRGYQQMEPGAGMLIFNMENPVVGGYTPEQVALRRAIGLGMDVKREIAIIRNGQGMPAQSAILPFTANFDPKLKTEHSDYDPARAKALLDLYGFVDRNGDGWRERPDGSPLTIVLNSQPDSRTRPIDEFYKKNMDAIGVRLELKMAQWPENLKATRAGNFMMWNVALSAAGSDAIGALAKFDSRQLNGQNLARFKMDGFDEMYSRMQTMPDGPDRDALFDKANRMSVAWMPYKFRVSRIVTDMAYPQLIGYRRAIFWQEWWHYVDIDTSAGRPKAEG